MACLIIARNKMSFIYKEMSNKDKRKIQWKSVVHLHWARLQTIKQEKLYWAIDSEQKFYILLNVDGDWTGEYLLRYGVYSYKGQQVKFAYKDDFSGNVTIERLVIPIKMANNLNLIVNLFKEGVSTYMTGALKRTCTSLIINEIFIQPNRPLKSYYYDFRSTFKRI